MSKFRNIATGVVVSVSDDKDARFTDGWVPADPEPVKRGRPPKKAVAETK